MLRAIVVLDQWLSTSKPVVRLRILDWSGTKSWARRNEWSVILPS